MDHVFNVGDTVKLTHTGNLYTTYRAVADLMHLTNWLYGRGYELGEENLEGETAEVVAIQNHPCDACITLLGIRMHSTNYEYIISSDGVE